MTELGTCAWCGQYGELDSRKWSEVDGKGKPIAGKQDQRVCMRHFLKNEHK